MIALIRQSTEHREYPHMSSPCDKSARSRPASVLATTGAGSSGNTPGIGARKSLVACLNLLASPACAHALPGLCEPHPACQFDVEHRMVRLYQCDKCGERIWED